MLERLNRFREKLAAGKVKEKLPMMEALQQHLSKSAIELLVKDYVDVHKGGRMDVITCVVSIDHLSELVCTTRISFTDMTFMDGGKSVGHNRRSTDKDNKNPNVPIRLVSPD